MDNLRKLLSLEIYSSTLPVQKPVEKKVHNYRKWGDKEIH